LNFERKVQRNEIEAGRPNRRTFVVVLDPAEDAVEALPLFAGGQGITGASLTAVAASQRATVGWLVPSRFAKSLSMSNAGC